MRVPGGVAFLCDIELFLRRRQQLFNAVAAAHMVSIQHVADPGTVEGITRLNQRDPGLVEGGLLQPQLLGDGEIIFIAFQRLEEQAAGD